MRVTSCNGDAVTSRSPVLDSRKNETLDVVTSKERKKERKKERNVRVPFAAIEANPGY